MIYERNMRGSKCHAVFNKALPSSAASVRLHDGYGKPTTTSRLKIWSLFLISLSKTGWQSLEFGLAVIFRLTKNSVANHQIKNMMTIANNNISLNNYIFKRFYYFINQIQKIYFENFYCFVISLFVTWNNTSSSSLA